ncbi:PfkB family carbohydrate kinase [Streptomyces pseudogriseolus]|uniref:PfkB family carbohydrate kinase n=1 Tax=Streptomyces pseudogriseolus TaxID=36817 RepID=UPI003FA20B64
MNSGSRFRPHPQAPQRDLLPGPGIVVVKDGSRTATAFTTEGPASVPALRTRVVEPVGAGDAFAAGFLTGVLRGETLTRALRLGHITAVSALQVTADHGPLPPPRETERLLSLRDEEWQSLTGR